MSDNEISQYPPWCQVLKEEREERVKILAKLRQGQNKHTESALSEYGCLFCCWCGLVGLGLADLFK